MRLKTFGLVLGVAALALALAEGTPGPAGHAHDHAEDTQAQKAEAVEAETEADLAAEDSSEAPSVPQSRADSVVLIRHQFNHREQIIAGGVVMACIAAMMAVMNNYNPR